MRQTTQKHIDEALACLPEQDEFYGKTMQTVFPVPFLRAVFKDINQFEADIAIRVGALESLRPHWAQGYTSDSVAAQASTAALSQLWGMLKVESQTDAVQALQALLDYGRHGIERKQP